MKELIFSQKAINDLDEITNYIEVESGSLMTAENFKFRILDKCKELSSQPFQMGKIRPELGTEIRSHAFGNYIIFFRYGKNRIEIISIIEGHRDIETIFH